MVGAFAKKSEKKKLRITNGIALISPMRLCVTVTARAIATMATMAFIRSKRRRKKQQKRTDLHMKIEEYLRRNEKRFHLFDKALNTSSCLLFAFSRANESDGGNGFWGMLCQKRRRRTKWMAWYVSCVSWFAWSARTVSFHPPYPLWTSFPKCVALVHSLMNVSVYPGHAYLLGITQYYFLSFFYIPTENSGFFLLSFLELSNSLMSLLPYATSCPTHHYDFAGIFFLLSFAMSQCIAHITHIFLACHFIFCAWDWITFVLCVTIWRLFLLSILSIESLLSAPFGWQ